MTICSECERRDTCVEICDEVRMMTYGGGKSRKRRTYPVDYLAFEAKSTAELNRFQIDALQAISYRPTDEIELRILLEQVLSILSEGQRFVFIKKMEGYTNREIADLTGLTEKAIEQRHTRAKKRLERVISGMNGAFI
ncbi:MAG: sigma-70 family RNA polymerase sigma factor [Candidatus Coatesbacteria bacterium]|nr:sigma-70 family RNA polymerase sigma factor [Candidatus Coatesbacteria bacterium]